MSSSNDANDANDATTAPVLDDHPTCETKIDAAAAPAPSDDHPHNRSDDPAAAADDDETTQPVDDPVDNAPEQGQKRKEPEVPSEPADKPQDAGCGSGDSDKVQTEQPSTAKKQKADDEAGDAENAATTAEGEDPVQ